MGVKNWSESRVAVTGATGIVGSWLCRRLIKAGAKLTVLIRDSDSQSEFFRAKLDRHCSIVNGTLDDGISVRRLINGSECDTVFHLGAQTIVGAALRDPLETFESNIRGTYFLLDAIRTIGSTVKATVVASSDKAYGDSPILPYTENMPLNGRHPYDVSKSCTDLLALTYAHTYGMPIVVARCGNIYGGGDLNWSRIVPGTIRSILARETVVLRSNGAPIRDYVFVEDIVDAYLACAESADKDGVRGEAFNFSPETRVSVREIVGAIGQTMGVRVEPIVMDEAVSEIIDQTLDSRKARDRLSWLPAFSLEDGLRRTIPWYKTYLAELGDFGEQIETDRIA